MDVWTIRNPEAGKGTGIGKKTGTGTGIGHTISRTETSYIFIEFNSHNF